MKFIGLHPVSRILCFLSLVGTLAHANLAFIVIVDVVFLVFAWMAPGEIFVFSWRLARRMRWFWLSIILLYTLMTPGGGPSFTLGVLQFSLGGFWLGLTRCLALMTVLFYFALLIHTTPVMQLQGALYWILLPLTRLGLPANRLSIRIALTLQKIHELQSRWSSPSAAKLKPKHWKQIPERVGQLVHEVFDKAEAAPSETELTLETSAPGYWQWLVLVLLITLITFTRYYTTYYI